MASCALCPCSHRISLLTGTQLVPLHHPAQTRGVMSNVVYNSSGAQGNVCVENLLEEYLRVLKEFSLE
eukprot:1162084-Pelagomonas_calceolata.AAC.2